MPAPASPLCGTVGSRLKVAVFLLGMCALVTVYAPQPLLGRIAAWARVPEATAAWTISAATLGVAVMAPVAGAVSDRLGRKRVMQVAVAVLLVTTGLCALAGSFEALLALRFVQGLATPFVFAVTVAYLGDELPGPAGVRLNALSVAGTAFGGFAGRLLPGLAADVTHDWRPAFLPLTAVLALAFVTTTAWLPAERRFVPTVSLGAGLAGMGAHLRDRKVLATAAVGAGLLFQQVASFTFGSLRLQQPPLGLSAAQIGLVFAVFLAPVLLTPQVGRAVERHGRVPTLVASAALGVAGLLLTLAPSVPAVVTGLACSCIAVFAGQACATGFLAGHATVGRSAAVGLYLTAYYLGGTVGGVAPGPVFSSAGWGAVVALLAGVTTVTTTVGALAWRAPRA
ncbi:MFS transporter [Amnibacterium sp.]|uniref:MFS transporter n=1 Tax=Amnibacterium sp. TaxID=1872496 RepID=UPI003F7B61E6